MRTTPDMPPYPGTPRCVYALGPFAAYLGMKLTGWFVIVPSSPVLWSSRSGREWIGARCR